MVTFHIPDMTCGHCASKIAKAVAGVDASARTEVGIAERQVRVTSAAADSELLQAIQDAGYHPVQVESPALAPAQAAGGCRGSCCCG
jgi:copper chaperone